MQPTTSHRPATRRAGPAQRLLVRLAEPPRLEAVEIAHVHGHRGRLGTRVTLGLRVGGFNPNPVPVRAQGIHWQAWVPGVAALRVSGEIEQMVLGARAAFWVTAHKEIAAASLPADLLRRDGTVPMVLSLCMRAHTPVGTVCFGRGSVEPMRSLSPRVALTNRELYLTGELGPDQLLITAGLPRPALVERALRTGEALGALVLPALSPDRVVERMHRALDGLGETARLCLRGGRQRVRTPITIRFGAPLGIPFRVQGGTLSVLFDGVRLGTARVHPPRLPGDTGQLRAQLTTGVLSRTQLRALLAARCTGPSRTPILLQGCLRVGAPPGGSIGRLREVRLNLTLGSDNIRWGHWPPQRSRKPRAPIVVPGA